MQQQPQLRPPLVEQRSSVGVAVVLVRLVRVLARVRVVRVPAVLSHVGHVHAVLVAVVPVASASLLSLFSLSPLFAASLLPAPFLLSLPSPFVPVRVRPSVVAPS